MVGRIPPVYLFLGQDSLAENSPLSSKEKVFKKIKEELLSRELEQFNLDILYAREITLPQLQERFLALPVKAPQRIILIKDAQFLRPEARNFILRYVKKPFAHLVVVVDMEHFEPKDELTRELARCSRVFRFSEKEPLDTFVLSRQISLKKPDYALVVLNKLLSAGEKPERILGGLRYAWEREAASPLETRKKLRLLLSCDIAIKTGRLKPQFALERLVLGLCGFSKAMR